MSEYVAPLRDMRFVLEKIAGLDAVSQLPGFEDATADLVWEVLGEAAKLATSVLSPLNRVGDREGARWNEGGVSTAPGWKDAYALFASSGWTALACSPAFGGQNLPRLVSTLIEEIWNGANASFALCPMLTRSAIEALDLCASDALKNSYLPKMVAGDWTGTMALTEPQAGSDLSALRVSAAPRDDGSYGISGQKIFVTYGDHDLADNIVHMVLARTPHAPVGVKGVSLFLVPKFLVKADGTLGERNDVHCVSIEHKLGIHGSPTCVLAFGAQCGTTGYLVGEENRGLECMFVMMNAARFSIGVQAIGIAERAYQRARSYARERIQGREVGAPTGDRVRIDRHPDVRRMLMLMKCQIEAMRALACVVAAAIDAARGHPDDAWRRKQQGFVELMIPVVKGWCTESAVEIASLGVQVHGGTGYVEESGAAQHLRDARITTLYEGTTGIQANDLIGRKIGSDGGDAIASVIAQMRALEGEFAGTHRLLSPAWQIHRTAIESLEQAVKNVAECRAVEPKKAFAGATPFLKLLGITVGGWQLLRGALSAARHLREHTRPTDDEFYRAKIITARFYADHVLSQVPGLAHAVVHGADGTLAMLDDQL